MNEKLKEYLWNEWRTCNHNKYLHLFDMWINNLTENQILYLTAYSNKQKTPYEYLCSNISI